MTSLEIRRIALRHRTGALLVVATVLATVPWACGGKAIVDGASTGGGGTGGGGTSTSQGGTGGSTTTTTSHGGTGGVPNDCPTPPPQGTLEICGGSGTSSSGQPMCATANCDDGGHTWWSDCVGSYCECDYDDQLICTCEIATGSCDTQPTCCPSPPWAP